MNIGTIFAADLYCGAGGASAGFVAACRELGAIPNLVAVNHWDVAIETHSANFPESLHLLNAVEKVEPRQAVPGGRLHLLLAGPSCTHFSQARGGRPTSDQQRSGAWEVIRWARELVIENILVENVPEFITWGPIGEDGKPCKQRRGMYFKQWVRMLRDLGYTVEHRVLCAANFGDATTRKRLFVQARKSGRIVWPTPTHMPPKDAKAFKNVSNWKTAREVIDWSIPGESIFGRKRPLAPNTLRRIFAGLEKFCGLSFTIGQQSCAAPRSTGDPLATVSTAGAIALVQPFLVILRGTAERQLEQSVQGVDSPVPTLATGSHVGVCEPFIMVNRTHGSGPGGGSHSLDEPVRSLTTGDNMALIQPFIVPQFSEAAPKSTEEPLGVITTTSRGMGIVQPFLVTAGGPTGKQGEKPIDSPLGTVLGQNHTGLCQPYLIRFNGGGTAGSERRTESVDAPLTTLDTSNRLGLAEPFLLSYYGASDKAQSIGDPLDTVTTRDRFALIEAELIESGVLDKGDRLAILDIRFRMLQPHELAAAHSFPSTYHFAGNREAKVKQVGNSWPVSLSTALCRAILSEGKNHA